MPTLYNNPEHTDILLRSADNSLSCDNLSFKINCVNTIVVAWGMPLSKAAEFIGVSGEALEECLLDYIEAQVLT
jgi:hypothetical protein